LDSTHILNCLIGSRETMVPQISKDGSLSRLLWLVLLHLLLSATNAQGPDENRLLLLYRDTKGDDWFNKTGWKSSDTPVCDWFGIVCESFNKITEIRLPSNNLVGTIPSDIYKITSLQRLDVQDNQIIDGGLSGIKDSESLRVLQFAQNGITSLSDLPEESPDSLTEIHFTQNRLSGGFPIELTKLTSLERAFLSFNEISGQLPSQIGDLTNLRWLYLYDNNISGQLPTEIGLLRRCEIFTLAENPLSGTIPTEVENMVNLRTFSLHNNQENRGYIGGQMPLFKDSPKLAEIYLDGNQLTGTIRSRFLQHSDVTQELLTVGLSYNQLEGVIPTSLGRFSNLNINLVGNKISGIPDEFCEKKSWMTGLVEEYGCDAILCPKGFSNPTGRQQSEDLPCEQCPLGTDYLGSTSCAPDGSDRQLTELQTLALMFVALRGEDWVVKDGWDDLEDILTDQTIDDLAGNTDILYCDSFYGITCNTNSEIIEIDLTDNGLFGEVPYQVFELSKLQSLVVSRNLIDVDPTKAFAALGRSTTLTKLNLAGTKVHDLDGIGAATSLRNLILDGIDFVSAMPQELFDLSNLQRLHCQYTSFQGTLPAAIGEMTSLTM
jgi:Leucine-rich repeat (LRR) protein